MTTKWCACECIEASTTTLLFMQLERTIAGDRKWEGEFACGHRKKPSPRLYLKRMKCRPFTWKGFYTHIYCCCRDRWTNRSKRRVKIAFGQPLRWRHSYFVFFIVMRLCIYVQSVKAVVLQDKPIGVHGEIERKDRDKSWMNLKLLFFPLLCNDTLLVFLNL